MEPFEIESPGICPECLSSDIIIKFIPSANQARAVCRNCGNNYAVPHLPPDGERIPNQQARWSDRVISRWHNKCAICGRETTLHAHHIIPFKDYPEFYYNVKNGIALCEEHHIMAHGKKYRGGENANLDSNTRV